MTIRTEAKTMELKNLFDMVKADRYTQDGRDELAKLQETEDKIYQIGEISQKTGLQKTANGWVKPKETKFGKVQQNKEGQWGVQTKLGKGSEFIKHKNEKEARLALANYTKGYNTTERSKQDPHSDQARQIKHWNKEIEKIRKQKRPAEKAAESDKWEVTRMASGKIYDTPDRSHRIIERNDLRSGEKTFDIRDLENRRAEDIKGIKTLEEAKQIVKEIKENSNKPAEKNGPSRMEKEEAIRKDLGLRGENDLERFSDEQIEMMYQKSQRTPEQQKADFNNSKIGQAVNKGRQEFAAEKARQKKLASKTNAIGLPKENKPADMLSSKDPAILNKYKPETEEEKNEIKKMQQFMEEETGATLRNAILARESYYNNSPSEYKNEAGKAALSNIKKIYGYGTQKDAAPRILTGDTRIRVKK